MKFNISLLPRKDCFVSPFCICIIFKFRATDCFFQLFKNTSSLIELNSMIEKGKKKLTTNLTKKNFLNFFSFHLESQKDFEFSSLRIVVLIIIGNENKIALVHKMKMYNKTISSLNLSLYLSNLFLVSVISMKRSKLRAHTVQTFENMF